MQQRIEAPIVLFSLWLLMFSSSSQFFIMAPILSQIGGQLCIPGNLRGTLISAYAITLGICALVTGPISDKIGRRKILLWGSACMSLALFIHPLAFDYWSILIIRALAGVAGGILTGSCASYIGDYFPMQKRGFANGVIITGSATGQILGIPIGTLMADYYSFDTPFMLFGGVMILALGMIWFFVPQPSVKLNDAVLSPRKVVADYFQMLKNPMMTAAAAGYLFMFFSITIFLVYFPTWLETDFGATSKDIALLFFLGGIATFVGGPAAGKLSDRRGRKAVVAITSVALAVSMLMSYMLAFNLFTILIAFFCIMFFLAGRLTSFQALAADIACGSTRGKLMCLTIAIGQVGMALGSGLAGFVYSTRGFVGNILVGALTSVVMASLVWWLIPDVGEPKNEVLLKENALQETST